VSTWRSFKTMWICSPKKRDNYQNLFFDEPLTEKCLFHAIILQRKFCCFMLCVWSRQKSCGKTSSYIKQSIGFLWMTLSNYTPIFRCGRPKFLSAYPQWCCGNTNRLGSCELKIVANMQLWAFKVGLPQFSAGSGFGSKIFRLLRFGSSWEVRKSNFDRLQSQTRNIF
jgi:hypothetical protein